MRKKIQRSMILCIAMALAVSYLVSVVLIYQRTQRIVRGEIRQEAGYICAALEISGEDYLKELDIDEGTRITLIDADGDVKYDSMGGDYNFENHSSRPEFQEAVRTGSGEAARRSDSLGQDMFYYAQRLGDGNVLRVSKTVSSTFALAMSILPVMTAAAALMLIFAVFFSKWQARRLVAPINNLDLDDPLRNDIYEELTPLLQRIDRQNREKESVDNMRKEFTANVSHELRTPLTSISGYAEILKEGMVLPEDVRGFSENIYNEAQRLIRLIEDIMKLSKLDEGGILLEKEDVDLYELIMEIIRRLQNIAEKKNVTMDLQGEHVYVHGVRQVLDEMCYNVCENAIKYNRDGGSVTILVLKSPNGPKVLAEDTGIGIAPEEQKRIFERFYRVDKSHSKETGGTGLGLSIVKHGAMLHNAEVKVTSALGQGTIMEICFEDADRSVRPSEKE